MTAHAEGDQFIFQKISFLGRTMGIVTANAPLVHRRMLKPCLSHGIADILMAIKTELVSRFQENKLIL